MVKEEESVAGITDLSFKHKTGTQELATIQEGNQERFQPGPWTRMSAQHEASSKGVSE